MSDLDRILAEELSPDADELPPYVPGIIAGEAAHRLTTGSVSPALERARVPTQFSATSQPLERRPMSASLRRRLRREDADAVNDMAIAQALEGNRYARDYLRDTLEGKPGVGERSGEEPDGGAYVERLLEIRYRVRERQGADISDET